jgi:hypothetical protein
VQYQITPAHFSSIFRCAYPDSSDGTIDGVPTHAAIMNNNGKWGSKLGEGVDVEHELNDLLSTSETSIHIMSRTVVFDEKVAPRIIIGRIAYGKPCVFMKREIV